ncbi:hypothetical protein [Mucilaginibacter pedocola]|uniref:Uncharacterized protein n=1 Tax=Mucilaginibacter pedocola TaxID=1792845 RepID=A0A1S9PAK6_9SPHI|nr:hypothetical protein [Mucilaginibacter pedocola]OOQ58014.1 hypothetical protein BC343_10140 [Mucilaginibacter pedocola]
MARYLTEEQLIAHLRLDKAVEQWLGVIKEETYTIIKWLRIDKESASQYSVAYFECFDEGEEDFVDIYEFSQLDPDEPFGVINSFDTVEDALKFDDTSYTAMIGKYVSAGSIQEEYLDYLESRS